MSISPFAFSSPNLPRLKAKQLQKAFPFLKLSTAQEATAQCLGYASWYECSHRGTVGESSPPDQDGGLSVRVVRFNHQAGVLVRLGITPVDADRWVRAWGLTGAPTLAAHHAIPWYYLLNDALERFDRGDLSEEDLLIEFGDTEWSKYPDTDRPERICPGVILAPCGKYPHYAVDPVVQARIPIYLRGPSSSYHLEDHGDILAAAVPGFPADRAHGYRMDRLNPVQYEWHHGTKHPTSSCPVVPALEAAALAAPDEMIVISQRAMPRSPDDYDFSTFALACLRGRDFADFIRSKGALDPSKVVWYSNVSGRDRTSLIYMSLMGVVADDKVHLPIFEGAAQLTPSLPVYSYPFMTAPMHEDEYGGSIEHFGLLPLAEDYRADDDEDEFDEDPDAPEGPIDAGAWSNLQPC